MSRSLLLSVLAIAWLGPAAPSADAQLQNGNILVCKLSAPADSSIAGYRLDGTLVYQTNRGTGTFWEGCALLPNGQIATSRRFPDTGVNLFGAGGDEEATFDTPQFSSSPGDVDAFSDGAIVVCTQTGGSAELYDAQGNHLLTFSAPGLNSSFGCHVDADDDLWIANNHTSGGVFHFDRDGTFLGSVPTSFAVSDLVAAPDGTLWVTARTLGEVYHLQPDGTVLSSFQVMPENAFVSSVGLLADGTLVFVGEFFPDLLHYDAAGNLLSSFGLNLAIGEFPAFLTVVDGLGDGPQTYCTAKTSSAACVAQISTSDRNQPLSGAGGYRVEATLVHSFKNGLLFGSLSGAAAVPFNGGTLCMNPPLKRGPIVGSAGVGVDTCSGNYSTEVNDGNVIPIGLDAGPGNSAWYQYWYRDPANGPGQLGTALSNAVQLDYQ